IAEDKIHVVKKIGEIGKLDEIEHLPNSYIGIGHTRWATHGGVSNLNAHPHAASDNSFVLAQNGIVENYQELKKMLASKGYEFQSETDTEVIVRLVEEYKKTETDLREAARKAFLDLKGRNTIIVLSSQEDRIIAIRNGSPLVVGIGEGETFFASDTLSFANKTENVVFIENYQMVETRNGELSLFDVKNNEKLEIKISKLDHDDVTIDKEGFDHFMMKEIVEQQHTIKEATQYTEEELKPLVDAIKESKRVFTVGAGTASFAAGEIAYFLRKYAAIFAVDLKSYEMGSFKDLFEKNDLIIAISQSGETTDTIEALEYAKEKGTKVASLVNMIGSTITRMSDFKYLSRSGPEICVASTKAFTAQLAWGLNLAMTVAGRYSDSKKLIATLAENLGEYFGDELNGRIKALVSTIKEKEHFFVLGKGQNFSISLEGALKIKEISYKHFEGFAAGELKHGVIALIEDATPVFVIVSNDEDRADMLTAAAEVKARGAYVIGIAKEDNELFDTFLQTPDAAEADPIANVIPFQLISYFLGVELGNSPDKPRNLAKSVTVK
ncbi:MAG TPA: glutamine--fructose-6-phosphate transaminase (isomerizing), partial [Candidatus Dojkabacteria bacterium]